MNPRRPIAEPSRSATVRSSRRSRSQRPDAPGLRQTLYDIIFEADTRSGRGFDIALLIAILASVAVVSLETVPEYQIDGEPMRGFLAAEWFLTLLFTVEYVLRLSCVKRPLAYAISFWGVIDLLSILPGYITYFGAVNQGTRSFVILRSVRLLRVFRVLKLWRMMSEADELSAAIWRSREKIIVFVVVVMVAVTISSSLMYFIEHELYDPADSDFTSIPQAMYWAIVTMTTVGYGDVVPHTAAGKVISAMLILVGYSLIIVPTGFVSAELSSLKASAAHDEEPCPSCGADKHRVDAAYCFRCGSLLDS